MSGRELWIDRKGALLRCAVVESGKLVAFEVSHADHVIEAGALFIAKIARVDKTLALAEVDLGEGQSGTITFGKTVPEVGTLFIAEWVSPARGDKPAVMKRLPGRAEGAPRLLSNGADAIERALLCNPKTIKVTTRELQKRLGDAELYIEKTPLFELMDIEGQIATITSREVALKGGNLVFDRTEACHVIDVNGAANALVLNRAALKAIAVQIRLRNLGGMILVDLIGDGRRIPQDLVEEFRRAVADDPCRVDVYGTTRLGFLEFTRARRGYELASLL